jgi:hypothetical protein
MYTHDIRESRVEELGFYEELISEGAPIQDLLLNNSSNVGDIGELLILAANYITELEEQIIGK